ncbi:hypothetical protein H0H81_006537 [Sphagnurus paluster]|uniref:2-dehydropantoate 2-reductase n=1 Tax=Sphagnurus paluster TaxID=117069 RepID=A0A9P7FTP0_9AGAR|nr:hypothetical protein H0H81_006537 [Sphagnurus paluster]
MATNKLPEILVVGFGAVGAIYSMILKKSGLTRVTAVARSNYDAVSEAADRPYSYVFVTTKAIPERVTTPKILAPLLAPEYADVHPQPTYVLLQNGLNVEADLFQALEKLGKGPPSIVSTAVWIGTNLLGPNVVQHNHFAATLVEIGGILSAGGTEITIVGEVQRLKFAKNFWNVTFSPFATLTTLPALFRDPPKDSSNPYSPYVSPTTAHLVNEHTIPTIRATLQELLQLGRALGYDEDGLPSSLVDDTLENTRQLHAVPESEHKPSMMLDMEKGQPIEVEVILGEVVRMAQERGVSIPASDLKYL